MRRLLPPQRPLHGIPASRQRRRPRPAQTSWRTRRPPTTCASTLPATSSTCASPFTFPFGWRTQSQLAVSGRCLPACLGCFDCTAMRYAHVQVMMHAGPLQARLQALGAEHMAGLRRAFCRLLCQPGCTPDRAPCGSPAGPAPARRRAVTGAASPAPYAMLPGASCGVSGRIASVAMPCAVRTQRLG